MGGVVSSCIWEIDDPARTLPELEGGNLKSGRFKIFDPLLRENALVFQLNNALIYIFSIFRTKREKRVHLGQDKERSSCHKREAKLSFHHEGGAVAPNCTP